MNNLDVTIFVYYFLDGWFLFLIKIQIKQLKDVMNEYHVFINDIFFYYTYSLHYLYFLDVLIQVIENNLEFVKEHNEYHVFIFLCYIHHIIIFLDVLFRSHHQMIKNHPELVNTIII